jgi:hypothetical protein
VVVADLIARRVQVQRDLVFRQNDGVGGILHRAM